jgi:hypothetical protein
MDIYYRTVDHIYAFFQSANKCFDTLDHQPLVVLNVLVLVICVALATSWIFCNRRSPLMDKETKRKFMLMQVMTNALKTIHGLTPEDQAAFVMSASTEILKENSEDQ